MQIENCFKKFVKKYFHFFTDKKMFQIQFGPIEYCLNWEVSLQP